MMCVRRIPEPSEGCLAFPSLGWHGAQFWAPGQCAQQKGKGLVSQLCITNPIETRLEIFTYTTKTSFAA